VDNSGAGDYQGLFGSVAHCTLVNIRIESGLVVGNTYTAGVVAKADAGTHITNCSNNARVAGGSIGTGGVVGLLEGDFLKTTNRITNCSNSGAISGGNAIGGVAGVLTRVYVTGCSNSGVVNGGHRVGGVAGVIRDGSFWASYNSGEINGFIGVGGVLGTAGSGTVSITACYNSGAVYGTSGTGVGGVAPGDNLTITDSYWLYNPNADALNGRYDSDEGCTRFGEGSWPADNYAQSWGVGSDTDGGRYWKTLGAWAGGGTPDGVNSTFPKLHWED
jgi:hypothetical protein